MDMGFVILFLLSCLLGGLAAMRTPRKDAFALAGIVLILCSAGLAGSIIAAAEAGSIAARYLGLLAVLLASAVLTGSVMALRRMEKDRRR
ncbi:hypothetical protein [Sphingobium sp. DC-2]|uniref:hypothetical protein n=1 Tax=Sphingobium sp. DC-2 TaxID=1303256 RepID=UPI0004C46DCE|nr:hypothetical protein [Sphingobium sp. DC-2]